MSYELKTKRNKKSVNAFLNAIEDDQKRKDAKELKKLMQEITGEKPTMWGTSIVGYGTYHYQYASGQSGDWPMAGFSPRKNNLTIYIMPGFDVMKNLLKTLGPHKTGKSCLYIRTLENVHLPTLKKIIKKGYTEMKKRHPSS